MDKGKEKGTPAVVGQNVPTSKNSMPIIAQNQPVNQGNLPEGTGCVPDAPTSAKGKRSKGSKVLSIQSKVYSVALKFYDEQLPKGEQAFVDAVRNSDKRLVQVLAIKHDRDLVSDGIWQVAQVKPHWHVIVRMNDRKRSMRVKNILDGLCIEFRPNVDDALWAGHGVETIGNFAGYATYLTHDTDEAIKDAKERYDVSEIVSNLTPEEVEQVREGYVRVSEQRKVSQAELIALDKEAFDMGYNMKNFTEWYNEQPFSVRSNAKMRVIRESYDRGVEARIEQGQELNRLCIFIQGASNTGKTYAAKKANAKMRVIRESYDRGVEARIEQGQELNRLCIFIQGASNTGKTYAAKKAIEGRRILSIGGGGTGKFDRLRPDHDAIVVDDDVCPNLLNMTDNYITHAYKRNSNNPAWAGRYFVVTSNLTFEEWLEACGIRTRC